MGSFFRLWPFWMWFVARMGVALVAGGLPHRWALATVAPAAVVAVALLAARVSAASYGPVWIAALGAVLSGAWSWNSGGSDTWLTSAAVMCFLTPVAVAWFQFGDGARRPAVPREELKGSARWMTLREARRILASGTLIVGEACDPRRPRLWGGRAPLLRFDGSGHLLTVAGAGSGKSTSVAIPNCLSWKGGLVALDPKGELAATCAAARRAMGKQVIILDSGNDRASGINVLDWLDPARDSVVENVVAMISWLGTGEESTGDNKYFEDHGRNLLTALLLDIACDRTIPPASRNLSLLRERVAAPNLIERLEALHGKGSGYAYGVAPQYAGELAGVARSSERTWVGIQSVASQLTAWLAIPSLARLVCDAKSTYRGNIGALNQGDCDIFLCVPVMTLDSTPAVARLILGTLLNSVYEYRRSGGESRNKVLFLLDEMPRLRNMPLLATARDVGRGFGIVLWAIVQDLGQLTKYYSAEGVRSWLENSQIKTFFGVSSVETAELLSRMLGDSTVEESNVTLNQGRSREDFAWKGHDNRGKSHSSSVAGRPLMTPDEVMRMTVDKSGVPDEQLVLVRGQFPLRCGMAKWYRRKEFSEMVGLPK